MNFFKIIKILSIIIVFMGIAWFGTRFSPFHTMPAEAKVYERFINFTRDMPNYLFYDDASAKPRKVIVNGNTTYLSVEKTPDDIKSVFDFYQRQIPPQPVKQIDVDSFKIDDPKARRSLITANTLLKMLEPHQYIRVERDDYGFFGKFEFNDPNLAVGSEEFFKAIKEKIDTGRIGELGVGRIVVAYKDRDQDETTIVKIWTDRDFDLNNMMPQLDGDIPGKDIDDVDRYPGDNRIVSLQQDNKKTFDRIAGYSGNGSVSGHILYFHSRLPAAGWTLHTDVEQVIRQQAKENVLFYTRKGREVTIQVNSDDNTGEIITTVIERADKKL
jgi:hypothetical protein